MAKRRAHGEGTISRRKDGRWVGLYQVGVDENGERIRKAVYGRTQREVRDKLESLKGQLKSYGHVSTSGKLTMSQLLDSWLAANQDRWKASTARDAQLVVRTYLKPRLGGVRVADLDAVQIEFLIQSLTKDGKSSRVCLEVYRALGSALKRAVRQRLIPRNPVEDVDVPRYEAPERVILEMDEAMRFLESVRGDRFYPAIVLAMLCGLRASEIWGLTWSDLDFDRADLAVRRTLNERKLRDVLKGGQPIKEAFEMPKTKRSTRRIALPAIAIEALRFHRAAQQVASVENLVFTTAKGEPIRHTNFYRHFEALLEQAGLERRISFHDLRHLAATLMLMAGVDLKVVSTTLGHANAGFTANVYAHVLESMQRTAADKMVRLLGTS